MWQLFRVEWMKQKNYRAFWILLSLYLVSIIGSNYIGFRIQQEILASQQAKNMAELVIGRPPFSFPDVWQTVAYISSLLLFIPGLIMILSVTNEYSYKTTRQNIIDGWSRRDFISTKIFLAIGLAVISTIMVVITAMLFGFTDSAYPFSMEGFVSIGYFFIQAISYIMMALLMAVFIKRGGLAIGVYFMYAVVLETGFSKYINHFFPNVGNYFPLQSTDELIPPPIFNKLKTSFFPEPDYTSLLPVCALYLAAYCIVTVFKFERDNL